MLLQHARERNCWAVLKIIFAVQMYNMYIEVLTVITITEWAGVMLTLLDSPYCQLRRFKVVWSHYPK